MFGVWGDLLVKRAGSSLLLLMQVIVIVATTVLVVVVRGAFARESLLELIFLV